MGLIDNLTPGLLSRLRLGTYTLLLCFSFFIFIGSAVMKDNYGACPLYADSIYSAGSDANCNFPIAISVIFQFLYLLFRMGLFVLVACGRIQPDSFLFNDTCELIYVATDLIAFFFTFISACILSAGRNDACHECNKRGDWHSANDAAQAGAWISTFAWLFIGVSGLLCAIRAGKIPGLGDGAVRGSNTSGEGGGMRSSGGPNNDPFPSQKYQDPLGP